MSSVHPDPQVQKELLRNQKDEIIGFRIYSRLAASTAEPENRNLLSRIARDEKKHYDMLKSYSGQDVRPSRLKVFLTLLSARILGISFTLKLMERGEEAAPVSCNALLRVYPEVEGILQDEDRHETELLEMLREERLEYMGSIVLGLNDALVELSGALAGFTFAIQESRTIALMGLITGISASFSMAASEFLSKKQENESHALRSSIYTGITYIVTVLILVLPFFLFANPFLNLGVTLALAVLIILAFNFYIAVAKNLPFRKRFLQMAGISLGVALLSFLIGWAVRNFLGFDI